MEEKQKETLEEVLGNPFLTVLVAGERVNQLQKGAKPRTKASVNKPTFIALEELKQGKLEIRLFSQAEDEDFSLENLDDLTEQIELEGE